MLELSLVESNKKIINLNASFNVFKLVAENDDNDNKQHTEIVIDVYKNISFSMESVSLI